MKSFISHRLREQIFKVEYFMEVTVPRMLPEAFRRFFRMQPATVNKLVHFLMPCPRLQHRENRRSIPLWKKVYMTLSYLGTQATTFRYGQKENVQATMLAFCMFQSSSTQCSSDEMVAFLNNLIKNMFCKSYHRNEYKDFYICCRSAQLFDVSESAYLQATEDVMMSLIDNMKTFIHWPDKGRYEQLARHFDLIGKG